MEIRPEPLLRDVVASNLRAARERAGLTLADASAQLAAHGHRLVASGISKSETGLRRVDAEDLDAFATIYRCSVSRFFIRADDHPAADEVVSMWRTVDEVASDRILELERAIEEERHIASSFWQTVVDHAAAFGSGPVERAIARHCGSDADVFTIRLHNNLKETTHVDRNEGDP